MDSIKLWARNGEAVRQAIELGEIAHIETASEELTDEFLLFAIESGLLKSWAGAFPEPRREPEMAMEVILPAHIAARFAGLYSMRKAGDVLRSARVLGALGYSVEVVEPERGLSLRGTSDDKLFSGDVVRKLLVQMEQQADLSQPVRRTGSPTAVTHRRLPQNVACGFPALRSSDDDSQHSVLLQSRIRQAELRTLERVPPLDGQEGFPAHI